MYLKGFDVLSLLKDEIKKVTSASFHIRIESDTAVFYRVNRKLFSKFLSENKEYLARILSNILNIDKEYILDNLVYKNTEHTKLSKKDKRKISDLIVEV